MPDTDPGRPVPTPLTAMPTSYSVPHEEDGWTIQRLHVLHEASGICARCGMAGADTATRGWAEEYLVNPDSLITA